MKLTEVKFICLFIYISCFFNTLFSAGPIVHYYLADKFIKTCCSYTEKEEQRFFLGTLFPDIRYMANIPRKKTHYSNMDLKEIYFTKDPFVAGKKFHTYVDIVRKRFIDKKIDEDKYLQKFQEELMDKYYLTVLDFATFLKSVEDERVFNEINGKKVASYLSTIDPQETNSGINIEILKKWHEHLKRVFLIKPSQIISNLSKSHQPFLNFSLEVTGEWIKEIRECSLNEKIKKLTEDMIKYFQKEFTKFKKTNLQLNKEKLN